MYNFHKDGTKPTRDNSIFVFGSNLLGIHGAGAAREAHISYDAEWGIPIGRTGECYAIPTKDKKLITLPINEIKPFIDDFIEYASLHYHLNFFITRIGCGLAGYEDKDIAPLFKKIVKFNCSFAEQWRPFLNA